MSQPPAPRLPEDDDDDTSHVSTPVLTHLPASPLIPSSLLASGSTSSESTKPTSVLPGTHLRLPIPTPSANLSQTSFTFVDVSEDGSGVDFNDLPPEVASADISIAREFLCSISVYGFGAHISPFIAQRTSVLGYIVL